MPSSASLPVKPEEGHKIQSFYLPLTTLKKPERLGFLGFPSGAGLKTQDLATLVGNLGGASCCDPCQRSSKTRKYRRQRGDKSDELPFTFERMYGFSTVDGFVEIAESSAEMIKYIANEPSTGLFYIQQHTKNAVPNVINLKNSVVDKSHETTLHTEDSEDSITMLRSMKECGFPIADEMIGDIKKSLAVMSTKQPRRGLIRNTFGTQQPVRMSTWRSATWGRSAIIDPRDDDSGGYISTVFKSAREKASNFKWPQLDIKDIKDLARVEVDKLPPQPNQPPVASAGSSSSQPDMDAEELPLSSQDNDNSQLDDQVDVSMNTDLLSVSDNFDDFRADKEAKLEEWLGGSGGLKDIKEI